MNLKSEQYYIDGVKALDRRILAKAITLVESRLPDHQRIAQAVVQGLLPAAGESVRIGITGVPGVGKSTFIENFGLYLLANGHRVAVLAVDPSSAMSGGSVMGDKTRMQRLAAEPQAYIRPSPSGGTLGGVARKTRETMVMCEAAGFDVTIVETVGTGQSETAVASMVDFFLVLMLAGAGDELQGIKKGVLELADAIAINKADGDNLTKAEEAKMAYTNALSLLTPPSPNWTVPVMTCSALHNTGLDEIWEVVQQHRQLLSESGELDRKRRHQALEWMWALVDEGLKARFHRNPLVAERLPQLTASVKEGRMAPTRAAALLLDAAAGRGKPGN